MKTKNIFYLIAAGAFALATGGCDKSLPEEQDNLPPVLESITLTLGATGEAAVSSRAINTDDPTLTECHERCAYSHRLAVTIGSETAYYEYNTTDSKWVPETAGICFPDFGTHDISMRLCSGNATPVALQLDGDVDNLLHADVLVTKVTGQAAVKELPLATMTHLHSLFDIRFSSTLTPADIESVKINGTVVPYVSACDAYNHLAIVNPGTDDYEIAIRYKGADYPCTVRAADVTGGEFKAHTRYIMSVGLQGGKLVCGSVLVKPWNEANTSELETGATRFQIVGYAGKTLDVKIAGADLFSGALILDASGVGALPFLSLADYSANIEYVQFPGHVQVPVNMPLGSLVNLTVDPATGAIIP